MRSNVVSSHQAGPILSSILVSNRNLRFCYRIHYHYSNELSLYQQPIIMHFSTIFAFTALAGSALAVDHSVAVGTKTGDLVFKPDTINAAEGDTVTFKFWPKNHSIAQAAFNSPCTPLNNGFWSGFVPTADTQKVSNWTFTYEVTNASAPIWFYCTQGQHCQNGMVGVIKIGRAH